MMTLTIIGLLCLLWVIVRLHESKTARDFAAELRRLWRAAGLPGRALAVIVLVMCAQSGGSKGVSPVQELFNLLFWQPGSPWHLAAPADHIQDGEQAVAIAEEELVVTASATNSVSTYSFDWHAPDRLPYHEAQNVLAWTAWVNPTNISGTLYEDHYVAFNATASTNPAVILIEYARRRDNGTVERYSAPVVSNSYPQTTVIHRQSGSHTCYWFRVEVPDAFKGELRDWSGEALFGAPQDSGKGFDVLGTLIIDDGNSVWLGATTIIVMGGATNVYRNGINVSEASQ